MSFTTIGLPAEERIARWEHHNAGALIGLRCRMLGQDALEATELNRQVGEVQLARVSGNAHFVERSSDMIRAEPAEAIAVYLTLVGEAFFYHEDGVWTLRPGQLLMCDADKPFIRGFSRGLEELAVKVPRRLFSEVTGLPTLTAPLVRTFASGDPHSRTLARLVGRAVRAGSQHQVGERTVLDLLAVLAGRQVDRPDAHLTSAQTYIQDHLGDQALGAGQIAKAVGISERQLTRVFASAGESVPRYVLRLRLERAHALLLARTSPPVGKVAADCGFGSESYFSAAFKKRYDVRPVDLRRSVRAQHVDLTTV